MTETRTRTDCPNCPATFRWGLASWKDSEADRRDANAFLKLSAHIDEAHPEVKFFCPRGPAPGGPFKPPFDGSAFWTGDETCSYCGSLSADAFFRAVEAGAVISPTDKNYKVYVDLAEPHPDEPTIRMSQSGGDGSRPDGDDWIKGDEPAAIAIAEREGGYNPEQWVKVTPRGPKRFGKFYFPHLSEDEQNRFIDLLNAKKVSLAEPGHFYVLPYFIQRAPAATPAA